MTKKLILICGLFGLLLSSPLLSQGAFSPEPGNGQFTGGLGYTRIDDDNYISMTLRPEIAIGKIGIGLNIEFLYDVDKQIIRKEDWNESYDYFRILRYIRYGHKRDPFYARIGALDRSRIGHGFLMNYYTNETANYDNRKIGLALDIDFGHYGFETMTSNLGRAEIFGMRGYIRPMRFFLPETPIIKNLAVGASYVTDIDPDENRDSDDSVGAWGLDAELPLVSMELLYWGLYYDFGKILDYGNGQAFGTELQLKAIAGLFDVYTKFERRLLGEEFMPAFFGAYYEIERAQKHILTTAAGTDSAFYSHKADGLVGLEEAKGWYGELGAHVLGALDIVGTYQWLDENPNGILHLQAEIPDAVPKIAARATYDKIGIQTIKDFSLPNSVAAVGLGYKIYPFMMFYMDYIYTWTEDEQGVLQTQKRIQPSVSFVWNFPVGN